MQNSQKKNMDLNSIDMLVFNRLEKIENYAKNNNIPIIRKETAKLLVSFLNITKPLKILEIGSGVGYSGILMLNNSQNKTKLTTIEKCTKNFEISKSNFEIHGYNSKINLLLGDAINVLKDISDKNEKFDFIFLDGPKGQYYKYLPFLVKMMGCGSVLFADNILYRDMVFTKKPIPRRKRTIVNNLEKFLTQIHSHPDLKSYIHKIEDGISISIKRGEL